MRTWVTLVVLAATVATAAAAPQSVDQLIAVGARATLVGDWDRALRALRAAAGRRGGAADGADAARLAIEIARVAIERHFYHVEDRAAALAAADAAVRLAEAAGDPRLLGAATLQRARIAYRDAAWDEAAALVGRAHELSTGAGDRRGVGQAEYMLGLLEQMQGRLEPARRRFEAALALGIEVADVDLQSNANRHLGFVLREEDPARAARLLELSLLQRETMGSLVTVPFALATVAELEWADEARRASAIARLEKAIPMAVKARSSRAEAQARLTLGRWMLERGDRGAAAAHARGAKAAAARFRSKALGEQADKLLAETRRR
jgi:tetratricopeptide (TPR) repeat protein